MASILFNIARIYNSQFKCKYLKNEKVFLKFLFHYWNLHQISNILKKTMMGMANVFSKLRTVEKFVTPLCKKRHLGTRLDSRHVKVCEILAKSTWECFYHVFSLIWGKLIWKISPLLLRKSYEVFVNTLTADGNFLIQYCGNLQLPIQMQVSEKRKTFSELFVQFLESTSNFKHFGKRDDGLN